MPDGLSRRGRRLQATPPFPEYLQEHWPRMGSVYDAGANPGGYLPMAVAENLLLGDMLLERMAAVQEVPPRVLGYGRSLAGSPEFKRQMARFLGRKVLGREVAPRRQRPALRRVAGVLSGGRSQGA